MTTLDGVVFTAVLEKILLQAMQDQTSIDHTV